MVGQTLHLGPLKKPSVERFRKGERKAVQERSGRTKVDPSKKRITGGGRSGAECLNIKG